MSAGQVSPFAVLQPGHMLGKWTVGTLLGRGGAGTVYEVTHRNGIRGAVKVLHPELARDEQQVARFLREGAIANHLEHVGAVAALDDDRTPEGIPYVVFERLDGVTLADIVDARAPLPVDEALRITEKILDVLVVAHEKKIVHRDVKPANVLVLNNGGVKLLDFGLARTALSSPAVGLPSPTRSGAVIGTPGFMPPEQAQGRVREIDERSDLWAVSAMLYTMLTRERALVEQGAMPSSARVLPIRSVRASIPDVVARIVDRGLSCEREARFGSAVRMLGAVRFAIENLASSPALPSATSASDQTVRTSAVKRRSASPRPASVVFAAGIGIVFAVGILVVAWLAWRTA